MRAPTVLTSLLTSLSTLLSTLLLASAAAMAIVLTAWTGGGAAPAWPPLRIQHDTGIAVDTELVLAVDVSNSMDPEEQELQREGYAAALTSREFMEALRGGVNGRIAVTYVEWAALRDQKILLPWRLIDGLEAASAFAKDLAGAPYRRAPRTSIYGALQFAKTLFDGNGYEGIRRVVDVSGDGANNMGPPATMMRDDLVAAGITINGLPIMLDRPRGYGMYGAMENLDVYYEDCVIGGPGAFVIPIRSRDQFKEATRTKLVLEIAGLKPKAPVVPAQARLPTAYCS
jgi:hypothetical protein